MEQVLTGYCRNENLFYRLIRSKIFWLIFWVLSFSFPIYRSITRELPPPLPIISDAPIFSLTNEFGKKFGTEELKDKFYIVNFMFTNCQGSCPATMDKMDQIQKRIKGLGTKAQIVSFTVDPETDTPEALYKYARARNTNPYVWNFLTGPKATIQKIIVDGFKLPLGEKVQSEKKLENKIINILEIDHSENVVLVDAHNRIRGYYTTDKIGIDKLMIDLGLLVNDTFNYKNNATKGSI